MSRHRIEQAVVVAVGFGVGATLAICIAPGDTLLWVVAGIVLSVFSRAFFIRDLGGELLWPSAAFGHRHQKKDDQARAAPH